MVNPTGKKLEKLLFGIFDEAIQGVDTYNHNGSMWLIFTDDKKWVVEYTQAQTLWYNYYFFKNEMEIIGLDCVENKDLIQKWFESRFLNIDPVESTRAESFHFYSKVEDTIQNGVKEIKEIGDFSLSSAIFNINCKKTIRDGVKHTKALSRLYANPVEDTIQNGVKRTEWYDGSSLCEVEDTIQNGVKNTRTIFLLPLKHVEDTIQNGVKNTHFHHLERYPLVEDTIQNGVKNILDDDIVDYKKLEDTIQNGIKEK